MAKLLHPKATAVWLVDNTTISFKQIADLLVCTSWKFRASPMAMWPPV